jgi:integrase
MDIFLAWNKKLKDNNFGPNEPLFPRAKSVQEGYAFVESRELSRDPLSSAGIREIIKRRFAEAGLEYKKPHSFRHGSIYEAIDRADGAQEMKAISQNVGHSNVSYIVSVYGQLPEKTLIGCIGNLKREPHGQG